MPEHIYDWPVREFYRPYAFIQWKGTEVCMDCYCVCGSQFHIDSDFAYAVRCLACKRVFQMSANIEMREIKESEWDGCDIREDRTQLEDFHA